MQSEKKSCYLNKQKTSIGKIIRSVFHIFLFLTVIFTFAQCMSDQQKIKIFARKMNKACPYTVDGGVTVEKAIPLPDNAVRIIIKLPYQSTEDFYSEDIKTTLNEMFPPIFSPMIRNSKQFKTIRTLNTTVIISVLTGDNTTLTDIELTPEIYNNENLKIDGLNLDNGLNSNNIKVLVQAAVDLLNVDTPIVDNESGVTIEYFRADGFTMIMSQRLHEDIWDEESKEEIAEALKYLILEEITSDPLQKNLLDKGVYLKCIWKNAEATDSIELVISRKDYF